MKTSRCLLFSVMIFLIAAATGARACIWYQGTTLEGGFTKNWVPSDIRGSALLGERTVFEQSTAEFLRVAMDSTPSFIRFAVSLSDLPAGWPPGMDAAVELIFEGDPAGAVTKLTEMDRRFPDNYWICANLGAACELSGDVPAALRWVEKALAINPGAHEGTEWMHAAVLKARLALATDPAWLQTHTISGLPQGDVPAGFTMSRDNLTLSLSDIQRALIAHTFARVIFVKPPDAIAATLLTELAHVEARLRSIEDGLAVLKLADTYGAQNLETIRRRWDSLRPGAIRMFFHRMDPVVMILGIPAGAISLVLIIYFVARRRGKSVPPVS